MPVANALECGCVVTTVVVAPPAVVLVTVVAVTPMPAALAATLSVPLLVTSARSAPPCTVVTGAVAPVGVVVVDVVGVFSTMPWADATAVTGAAAFALTLIVPLFVTVATLTPPTGTVPLPTYPTAAAWAEPEAGAVGVTPVAVVAVVAVPVAVRKGTA